MKFFSVLLFFVATINNVFSQNNSDVDILNGIWDGYMLGYYSLNDYREETEPSIKITIKKESNLYKITKEYKGASTTEIFLCRIVNNKIIAEGNPKDFYKYQLPSVEISESGNLIFRDGLGDAHLKPHLH